MHDLIVVGAGLAGLAAARDAVLSGQDVLVLETRARTGGRILGHRTARGVYDLGPGWVWPSMQPLIAAAVRQAGLALYPQRDDRGAFAYQDATGQVRRLAHGFAQEPPSMRIEGGIIALADWFAAALPPGVVKLEHRVIAVSRTEKGVAVTCEQSGRVMTLETSRLILAMPPRLVAAMEFTPALPAHHVNQLLAVPTWMAGHAKALALYDSPVWQAAGFAGAAASQAGPLGEIHDASIPGSPDVPDEAALFGFFAWPAGLRAAQKAALPGLIAAQLGQLFGPESGRPREIIIQDWASEAATANPADRQGSAQHPHYRALSLPAPWQDVVRLAGSEVAADFGGYLEGALSAGGFAS
jgi:monoamine oxidase